MSIKVKVLLEQSIYFFCFVSFLMPWLSLGNILGGFELRFFHVTIFLLIIKKVLQKRITIKVIPNSSNFTALFLLLFILFFISSFWSKDIAHGISLFFKNVIYFAYFILISDFFLNDKKNFYRRLIKVSKISVLAFVFFNILASIVLKENILFNAVVGLFSNESSKINYEYFYRIVNFDITSLTFKEWKDQGFHVPSFRNVLGASLVIIYGILDFIKKPSINEILIKYFLIALVFLSQSRSTMLIFGLIFILKFIVNNNLSKKLILTILLSPILVIIGLFFVDAGLFNRFLELSKDARIVMYIETIYEIADNSVFGSGFGSLVYVNDKSYHVHNFLLASWLSVGIIGLFISFLILLELILKTINKIKFNVKDYKFYFIYGFPMLILIRMMIGGNNGLPSFQDWTAMSIFFMTSYLFKITVREDNLTSIKNDK